MKKKRRRSQMEGGGVIKFLSTRVTSLFWRWMPSSTLVGTLTFSPFETVAVRWRPWCSAVFYSPLVLTCRDCRLLFCTIFSDKHKTQQITDGSDLKRSTELFRVQFVRFVSVKLNRCHRINLVVMHLFCPLFISCFFIND